MNEYQGDKSIITKEQLQTMPDERLLEMVERAKGHTGADFKEYMNCDFSYGFLTGTLGDRGYVIGWYKAGDAKTSPKPEVVTLYKSCEGKRLTLSVDPSVAEAWHSLTDGSSYRQILATEALSRFISAVRAGQIKFELDLTDSAAAHPISSSTRKENTGTIEMGGLPDTSV